MSSKRLKAFLLISCTSNLGLSIALVIAMTQLRHERELQREAVVKSQEEVTRSSKKVDHPLLEAGERVTAKHPTWRLRETLNGHNEKVNSVMYSPDGNTLASGER